MTIELLGDHPSLIAAVGELRWKEWGHPPEPERLEDWIEITSREAGKSELPITWVALDESGSAVGAVGLDRYDIEERRDRTPWVVGTIVADNRRGKGIGTQLMYALKRWAKSNGYDELWVATGGRAVSFYQRCGLEVFELITRSPEETVTILRYHPDGRRPSS